ncbi:MAG: XAC2610-related protein [Chitinophagales bacterium]
MKLLAFFLSLTCSVSLLAQIGYSGFINKYPITLVSDAYSDGVVKAIYAYNKYDTPIPIQGILKENRLELYEKDENGLVVAIFTFENFDVAAPQLLGTWTNRKTQKTLDVQLSKDFDVEDKESWEEIELLQEASNKYHYFKLLITKESGVSSVKIFEKGTDKLFQSFEVKSARLGLNNVLIDDYNFDGINDFSVFLQNFAGPNTSSAYFLKNPKTRQYFLSNIKGTSLEFNHEEETIIERNSSGAGSTITTTIYKLRDNEMIVIEAFCYTWDSEVQELIEQQMDECE